MGVENKEEFKTRTKKHENLNIDEIFEEEQEEIEDIDDINIDDFYEEEYEEPKKEVKKEVEKKVIKKTKSRKSHTGLIVFISVVIIIGLFVAAYILMTPTIKLLGDKEIKLTINSEYIEAGVKAKLLGKDKTKDVKVIGEVNTKKTGTYTIVYKVQNLFLISKVKRTVTVVNEGPVIKLEGDKDYSICPKKKYEEVGFKANPVKGKEELEEDLSKNVEFEVKNDVVTYKVKDSNGVMYYTTRNLVREDKTAPDIKLGGNDHIYITLNNKYNEPGYTVEDNCDGKLDDKVKVEGTVDTSKLGDYKVTYTVKDKAGNEATKERTVTIQREIVRRPASLTCGEAGVIYLTFDDGPGGNSTVSILNTLKKYNIKATFFVTSANGGSDDLIKREFDEGHLIALHTSSHEYSQVYKSDEAYWEDLNKISARVERITGKKSKIVRFPGGSSNTVSRHYSTGIMARMAADLESKGYTYVDWNVDSRDAEGKNSDQIYNYTISELSKSKGNVVLMHDIKTTTANALERVIQYGLNNGYKFKVLDSSVICHHRTAN